MPYLGFNQDKFNKDIKSAIDKFYPMVALCFVPVNPLNIAFVAYVSSRTSCPVTWSPELFIHLIVPSVSWELSPIYIGCTERMLRVWVAGHLGTSHRACEPLGVKEKSAIREHTSTCKADITTRNFKIIDCYKDKLSLLIAEVNAEKLTLV